MQVSSWTQLVAVGRRSVLRTLRQPVNLISPIVFPLCILAVNVGGLDRAAAIPGFPTDNVLNFLVSFTFMQGALFAAINAGTDIARDIETGFMNRIALTPVRTTVMVIGEMSGALMMGLIQGTAYLAVVLIAGASIAAGVGGALFLIVLEVLMALVFGSIGSLMALRTGSGEAVQGLFPLMFILLFISSAIMPRDLIQIQWFKTVASINPVSYLIEGLRSLVITGWDAEALGLCLGLAAAITVVALSLCYRGMRARLVRV